MNTVDALNVLGKALCGDSFEVKPGLTDAETILEIAKNYSGGGSRSDAFEIPITVGESGMVTETTFDAIQEAYEAGKELVLSTTVPGASTAQRTLLYWPEDTFRPGDAEGGALVDLSAVPRNRIKGISGCILGGGHLSIFEICFDKGEGEDSPAVITQNSYSVSVE